MRTQEFDLYLSEIKTRKAVSIYENSSARLRLVLIRFLYVKLEIDDTVVRHSREVEIMTYAWLMSRSLAVANLCVIAMINSSNSLITQR